MKFYLISFDKQGKSRELCFWRAYAKGYTNTVTEAGELSAVEIANAGYHSGPNCVAVPKRCLPLLTSKLKSSGEPDGRLIVHVIPITGAKELLLGALALDEVVWRLDPISQIWITMPILKLAEAEETPVS